MKRIILLIIAILFSFNAYGAQEEWNVAKDTHFILYYKDVPPEFVDKVLERAEYYYDKISDRLGFARYDFWLWDDRAKIYIYKDVQDYIADTGQPSWSSGCASFRDKVIKTYPLASGFFDTLLPHELGHIIFREFVGVDNKNIPLWLDEGVASYQEMTKRFAAKPYVRKAIRKNEYIPLDKLTKMDLTGIEDKQTIDIFYLQAVTVVDCLIVKFGKPSFVNFCRALRDGKTLEQAISYVYRFNSLNDLNTAWLRYLKDE